VKKQSTESPVSSSITWENLEAHLRLRAQGWLQDLFVAELDEFLGRTKNQRRKPLDAPMGYRNGYGRPRGLTLMGGTVQLRRPRARGLEARFESRILPLFARRTPGVDALLPELYLHGLAQGDFDLALRGLLGEDAPLSPATIGRLKEKWRAEWEAWSSRDLSGLEVVYLWVDGVYVKAGLEKEKAALLVVLAALSDGRKEFVAVVPGHRESTEAWAEVLRDLKRRGLAAPRLVVGDGHLGIWGALRGVWPEVMEQRCWNHKIMNVLDKVPKRRQGQARLLLRQIPYAPSQREACRLKAGFQCWCQKHGLDEAAKTLERGWEAMLAFYRFPKEHWGHLRTTNPLESPFAALRLRTDAAKRFKRVDSATALVWKMLMVAERRFRRLNAPEFLREVYEGVKFTDGVKAQETIEEAAA
jgi:transposase-like protein